MAAPPNSTLIEKATPQGPPNSTLSDLRFVDISPIRPIEDDIFTGERQISEFAPIPIQGIFQDDEELEAQVGLGMYYHRMYNIPPEQSFDLVQELSNLQFGHDEPKKTSWGRAKQRYANGKATTQGSFLGGEVIADIVTGRDPNAMDTKFPQLLKILSGISEDYLEDERAFLERMVSATAEILAVPIETAKAGGKGAVAGGVIFGVGAFIAGQLGPQAATLEETFTVPAAILKGAMLGGTAAGTLKIFEIESGAKMVEFMQIKDRFGNKIDPKIAVVASLATGTINAGAELGQWALMLSTFGITTKIFEGAARKVSTRLFAQGTLNEIITRKVLEFGGTFTAEVSTEIFQETVGITSEFLAKELNNARKGTDFKRITAADVKEQLLAITEQSALAFPALLLPGTIVSTTSQVLEKKPVSEFEAARAEFKAEKAPQKPAEAPKAAEPTITPPEAVEAPAKPPATIKEATEQFKAKVKATPEGEAVVSDERMAQIRQRATQRRAERAEAAPEAVEKPAEGKVETIVSVASRFKGKIFEGPTHFHTWKAAAKSVGKEDLSFSRFVESDPTYQDGFITSEGRFVTREEATELAKKAKQPIVEEEISHVDIAPTPKAEGKVVKEIPSGKDISRSVPPIRIESGKDIKGKTFFHGTFAEFGTFEQQGNRGSESVDMGFHFGSRETSDTVLRNRKTVEEEGQVGQTFARGIDTSKPRVVAVELDIKNPLRLEEERGGNWSPSDVIHKIVNEIEAGREIEGISEKDIDGLFNDEVIQDGENILDLDDVRQESDLLQKWLNERGYDGIVYENKFEGGGDSLIAFKPEQIKTLTPTPKAEGKGFRKGSTILFSPDEWAEMLEALQFHIDKGVVAAKALTEELVADFGEEVRQAVPDLLKIVKPPKKLPKKQPVEVKKKPAKRKSLLTRRIEKVLKTEFAEAPQFDRVIMAEQAARVEKIWDDDPQQLVKISKQEEPLPHGLRMGSVLKGLEVLAREAGDVDILRDLAVSPATATVATEAAQELKAFDPAAFGRQIGENPVKAMREVKNVREKSFEKKSDVTVKQAIKKDAKAMKAETRKQASAKKLQQFIRDLEC